MSFLVHQGAESFQGAVGLQKYTGIPRAAGLEDQELNRGLDLLPKQYEAFWEAFAEAVDADVAEPVLALLDDPAPLVAELEARGTTLIHADIRSSSSCSRSGSGSV